MHFISDNIPNLWHLFIAFLSLHFTAHPQSISLVKNDDLILSCSAIGIPSPSIEWMFNGSKIENTSLINYNTTGRITTSTLTITMIQSDHVGIYSCIATNSNSTNHSIESNNATVTLYSK